MRNAGLPVGVDELRVLHVVEVDMRIDELQSVHEQISYVEGYRGAFRHGPAPLEQGSYTYGKP